MGQAKRNLEETRKRFIAEAELWIQPTTDVETRLVDRISKLPFNTIPRASPEQIAYMRMKPQQCHANCGAYVQMDPDKKSRIVTGWWKLDETNYVAHSVVERDGQMFCLTPGINPVANIEFASDPDIEWTQEGDHFKPATRSGEPIPRILRSRPDETIALSTRLLARLKSGMHPYRAIEID